MFRTILAAILFVSDRPVRFSVLLALLPVLLFALIGQTAKSKTQAPLPPPAELVPRSVFTEGIRSQRQDDKTFRRRWAPLYDVPPATEIHYVSTQGDVVSAAVPGVSFAPQPERSRGRPSLRSRPVRMDVCQRHNMRRVEIRRGKYWRGWRCRR